LCSAEKRNKCGVFDNLKTKQTIFQPLGESSGLTKRSCSIPWFEVALMLAWFSREHSVYGGEHKRFVLEN